MVCIISGKKMKYLFWHFGIQKKIFPINSIRFRKLIQQLLTHATTRNQRSDETKRDNGCKNN